MRKKMKNGAELRAHSAAIDAEEMRKNESDFAICRELIVGLASDYARHVLAPRILAERRRRNGDPGASHRDYDCQCDLSRVDELPLCDGRRAGCKFSHRLRPPGPNYRDGLVIHAVHRAEQEKVLRGLPIGDMDRFIAELRRLDREVTAEFRRIAKVTGIRLSRNTTGWL